MTHLYRLDADAERIARCFGAEAGHDPWSGGHVAPGGFAPVVIAGAQGERRLVPRLWGVPPPPAAALAGGSPVAHVRNVESPFWIGTLRHPGQRCLIPATAFQAWTQQPDPRTGKRALCSFALAHEPLFAMAGIWRDSEVPSFALLACEPNRLVGSVNPRTMPVILKAEDHERWLRASWKEAAALVAPFPSQLMTLHRAGA